MANVIRTPDQHLRALVGSNQQELAEERIAAREAVAQRRLAPVLVERGARARPRAGCGGSKARPSRAGNC